ncbi:MAG: HAMP domain-containing protein [Gemmatimonadales bacterium]|nr:MAG: HAMP domain-containing protein [Gemmatimonadales bacterium]
MRISTRIAVGLGLLIVLVVATAAYQLSVVYKLEGITRDLAGTRLDASRTAIALTQEAENVQGFAQRAILTGDPDYGAEWRRSEEALAGRLAVLESLGLGDAEDRARSEVLASWAAWSDALAPWHGIRDAPNAAGAEARLPGTTGPAAALRAREAFEPHFLAFLSGTARLLAENDASATQEATLAADAAERATWVAWVASALTVLGAILLGTILWLSISGPLRRLADGTRTLARGQFEHRIEDRSRSEFGALARDFNLMAERLDELEELKRDFVSHVSHELKGPLAAIQETILVLLDELAGPLTERQRHLLQLSEGSSKRLSRMISDLLEISRLEAGAARYDPAPSVFSTVIRDLLSEVEPLVTESGLTMIFEDHSAAGRTGGRLVADEDRMREVAANLVGNAIKFAPPGSRITVTLEEVDRVPGGLPVRYRTLQDREQGPFLLLSVEDQGPGIPPEHREGVFEKFYQVSIAGRKQGQGVGLGLAISRRIAEAHGGAIWVEAGPDRGSLFRLLVPVQPSRWMELEGSLPPSFAETGGQSGDPSVGSGSTSLHA